VSRAARAGLTIHGLGEFRYHHDPGDWPGHGAGCSPVSGDDPRHGPATELPAALVIGYGTPPDHAFAGAIDTLCDVLG